MWPDNETDVDLLGFDFLVDALVVALTEPRLLPVCVGLLGDWGSGKSSLMKIARSELLELDGETGESYLCVEFSPWQYEDYEDVKTALMNAVLDEISRHVDTSQQERISRLRRFAASLRRLSRGGARVAASAAAAAAPLIAKTMDPGLDPAAAAATQAAATAIANEVTQHLEDPAAPAAATDEAINDAGRFRSEFSALLAEVEQVKAVVVFVDDLDRCLPETVVDTFEAIRLFLNTPKTAYVIAANQMVVESAIDSRYPQLQQPNGTGIGATYLEKMLQIKIAIPPLSAPEADTYVNLLMAELHLSPTEFSRVLAETRSRRTAGALEVAFGLGTATEVLKQVPPGLAADLEWTASISEILGSGLRGNPRQLKRFLNNLLLKHRSAKRRKIDLELPVLAKLMALEEQHLSDFQRLFDWQLKTAGTIPELGEAEALARGVAATAPAGRAGSPQEGESGIARAARDGAGPRTASRQADEEVRTWADKPHIAAWLQLDPRLGEIDLRPYFTYSRDKLSFGVAVTRLPTHLQELLAKVQAEPDAVRRRASGDVAQLPSDERAQLVDALIEILLRKPHSQAFAGVLEIAEHAPDSVTAVCDGLARIPPQVIAPRFAIASVRRLPGSNAQVQALFQRWENSGVEGLQNSLRTARTARAQSGRR